MSLRDKIREKLTKSSISSASSKSKYDPEESPNLYELDNFLHKSGYRLADVLMQNDSHTELIIEVIREDHLHPDITHNIGEGRFFILVKEYGELDESDVEEIIKGYENALGVVKYLNSFNLDLLEDEIPQ